MSKKDEGRTDGEEIQDGAAWLREKAAELETKSEDLGQVDVWLAAILRSIAELMRGFAGLATALESDEEKSKEA